MKANRIYENPYVTTAPQGPESIFVEADVEKLSATIADLATTAEAGDRGTSAGYAD